MNPEEENEVIKNWGFEAIKSMKEHGISPLPENYTIWFEYHRGSNQRLNAKINKLIDDKKEFDRDVTRDLYDHFILNKVSADSVANASTKVQQIMESVYNMIDSTVSGSQEYNQDLGDFALDLEDINVEEAGNLNELISKIVTKARSLKQEGENLNSKLVESQKEVGQLKNSLEEVTMQVSLDALTGIANRKAFDDMMENHLQTAKEEKQSMCLLMLDVDHFKKFNDTYGHLMGDQVLKIVASALKGTIRGQDFCARYGGEEFAVILPDTPLQGGKIVAENIRKAIAIRELKRKDTGESYGKVTVSIGVAIFNSLFDSAETMIERADKGLYLSKENGRNMVSVVEA